MKVSHKVCKRTQNFVKKKLKAFPSRLDGFYTKQGLVLLLWNGRHPHHSEILRDGQNNSGTRHGGYGDVIEPSEAIEGSGIVLLQLQSAHFQLNSDSQ